MVDILEGMERDERAMERIACAFEVVADTLVAMHKLQVQRLEKEFPPKHEPRDSIVTRIPTSEELLRRSQGQTGEESTEEWMQLDIGPRERELLKRESGKGSETTVTKIKKS